MWLGSDKATLESHLAIEGGKVEHETAKKLNSCLQGIYFREVKTYVTYKPMHKLVIAALCMIGETSKILVSSNS